MNLIQTLQAANFRLGKLGNWLPKGEVFNGDANDILNQWQYIAARVSQPEREVISQQITELNTILTAQRVPFFQLNPKPSAPWMPVNLIHRFIMEGLGRDWVTVEETNDGYKFSDKEIQSYLTGIGRRRDKRGQYEEWDEKFSAWVIENSLEESVENAYNHSANRWIVGQWDSDTINIPGWNPQIVPHDYQLETGNRFASQRKGINALGTGLGKTIASIIHILSELSAKRIDGAAVIVPKNVLGKWRDEILMCCPTTKVMMIGAVMKKGEWEDDTSVANLSHQLAQAMANRPEIILMSHTTLSRIPMRDETLLAHIQNEYSISDGDFYKPNGMNHVLYDQYTAAKVKMMIEAGELKLEDLPKLLEQLKAIENDLNTIGNENYNQLKQNSKKEEKARLSFITRGAAIISRKRHGLQVYFEDLPIKLLVADEAHTYKGGHKPSGRLNARGLGIGEVSQIATDFLSKIRYIQAKNDGNNIILVTATPIMNSPLELYSMIHLVAPELFPNALRIHNADDFLERYAEIDEEVYFNDEGETKVRKYLKRLCNLRELRSLAARVIHRRTAKQVGLKLPKRTPEFILVKPTDEQNRLIRTVGENPLAALRDLMGIEAIPLDLENTPSDLKEDLLKQYRLVINHLLRRIELDLEMINPLKYKGFISPKVRGWLDVVKEDILSGQRIVVFCDVTTMPNPFAKGINPNGYSFHEKLKRLVLAETNLHDHEIAIVNATTCPDSEDRLNVSKDLKAGKLRLIIGNTDSMGQATDLQWGVSRLRSLDVPWNQGKLLQRRGRVERQGNWVEEIIESYHMGVRGFDPFMMDVLSIKANWYEEFWNGTGDTIEANDSNLIPSRAMIEALAIDDDIEREKRFAAIKEYEADKRQEANRDLAFSMFRKYQLLIARLEEHEQKYGAGRQAEREAILQRTDRIKIELERDVAFQPYLQMLTNPMAWKTYRGQCYTAGQRYVKMLGSVVTVVELLEVNPFQSAQCKVIYNREPEGDGKIEAVSDFSHLLPISDQLLKKALERYPSILLLELSGDNAAQYAKETFLARAKLCAAIHPDKEFPVWIVGKVHFKTAQDITENDQPVLPNEPDGVFLYHQWLEAQSKTPNPYTGIIEK
jgi:hypothetical protein